jgi:hypothetical protein
MMHEAADAIPMDKNLDWSVKVYRDEGLRQVRSNSLAGKLHFY